MRLPRFQLLRAGFSFAHRHDPFSLASSQRVVTSESNTDSAGISHGSCMVATMITLLDGGLGQEIQQRSKQSAHPLWSIKIMMENPGLVQAVEEDFIRAGARILTLNTYAATPTRLARDGDPSWFEPLQKKAFEIADAARKATGEPHGKVRLA